MSPFAVRYAGRTLPPAMAERMQDYLGIRSGCEGFATADSLLPPEKGAA